MHHLWSGRKGMNNNVTIVMTTDKPYYITLLCIIRCLFRSIVAYAKIARLYTRSLPVTFCFYM